MNKTTVLIYKDKAVPEKGLRVATQDEWSIILEENKGLPFGQKRHFIKDIIVDDGPDCIMIEVSLQDYRKWHSKDESQRQKAAYGENYIFVSSSSPTGNDEAGRIEDILTSSDCVEEDVVEAVSLEKLRHDLAEWNDWALPLFDYCMAGKSRQRELSKAKRFGVSKETMRRRMNLLRDFIKKSGYWGCT